MTNFPALRSSVVRLRLLAFVGAGAMAGGMIVTPDRTWCNLLLVTYYLVTLGLGSAVFVALACVTGAGWHVAFRRVPEALVRVLPIAGLALLLVLGIGISRYQWHHHGAPDAGTFWFKELWLTPTFWMLRAVAYILLWSLLSGSFGTRPGTSGNTGASALPSQSTRRSALFLAVFGVTFSLASADWIMALEPMWFSTVWGVYNFAGMMQATLAAIILFAVCLRSNNGPLQGVFSEEHLHDLAKLLLGFSCFWMYIWFCQYMLIWYANLPEETPYFIARTHGAWGPVLVLSIALNWVVPFFVLLPKPVKRSARAMARVAALILIGRWVDLYVMIFPATIGNTPVFGFWEAAAIAFLVGATGWLALKAFMSAPAVPKNDPYLLESLHYHAG